jgi:hypothetical protein
MGPSGWLPRHHGSARSLLNRDGSQVKVFRSPELGQLPRHQEPPVIRVGLLPKASQETKSNPGETGWEEPSGRREILPPVVIAIHRIAQECQLRLARVGPDHRSDFVS